MVPRLSLAMALALAAAAAFALAAGQRGATPTGESGESDQAGERLYRTYCATCHGLGGQGDGPMASQLRAVPADLTGFAASNGGVFPSERLREVIDGRGVRAHGIQEMPVWGDAFRTGPDGLSAQEAVARIDAIVRYLESLQAKKA